MHYLDGRALQLGLVASPFLLTPRRVVPRQGGAGTHHCTDIREDVAVVSGVRCLVCLQADAADFKASYETCSNCYTGAYHYRGWPDGLVPDGVVYPTSQSPYTPRGHERSGTTRCAGHCFCGSSEASAALRVKNFFGRNTSLRRRL